MEDLTENNTREGSAGQEGIVLKDRNGNDVIYYGIETVTFDTTTEGKQQTYSKGVIAEGIEVQLDLSDGDQTIQAPEGYLVKEATIKKPETLVPENIVDGVEVAGVVGTHKGGSIDTEDENMQFFAFNFVEENGAPVLVLHSVLYEKLYAANGSYDVTVPETLTGFDVLLG